MSGRKRNHAWVVPTVTLLGVLVVWEMAVRTFHVPSFLLPPPSAVARGVAAAPAVFLRHTWVTTYESVLGFLTATAIGIPVAVLMAASPVIYQMAAPLLITAQSIPKIAIAPLLLVWVGPGLESKIAMAVLIAFFPIIVDTATGLATANPDMLVMARSLRATRWQVLREIQFPTALPLVFSGLKVAVTLAVVGAVIGEFVGAEEGLGYLILAHSARQDTAEILACVFLLAMLGIVLYTAVSLLEQICIWWRPAPSEAALGGA